MLRGRWIHERHVCYEGTLMTIHAQQLQTWIGTDVLDSSDEKLGKLDDVYFHDSEPVAVSIRSGLGGRKHHAAALRGASVSRDHLHLEVTAETLVASHADGLGAEQLTELAGHDDRLHGIQQGELEGWNAREERLKAQAEAQARADELDAEARRHGKEEDVATSKSRDADREAEQARRARQDAEARAEQARRDADRPT